MRQAALTGVMVLAAAALLTAAGFAQDATKETAKSGSKLVGTWKLVTAKYGGQDFKFLEGHTMLKHVTPSQFMWATYDKDGKVYRAAGGFIAVKGDAYEETPEYGLGEDFEGIKGRTHAFKAKVEGNRWHSEGMLAGGVTIEEVWERLDKK
jgi:hypothetical protein